MNNLLEALAFLTILPLPRTANGPPQSSAIRMFPLAGAVIGLLAALSYRLVSLVLPPLMAAILAVCTLTAISGALHLDGLADTADGFGSIQAREKILMIMRDSRIGVMGTVAIIMVFALKCAALLSLPEDTRTSTLLLMPLCGRSAIVWNMRFLAYARQEGGVGNLFYKETGKQALLWATILPLAGLVLLAPAKTLAVVVLVGLVAFLHIRLCKKKINGATGDTLGAASELTETAVAMAMAVHLPL